MNPIPAEIEAAARAEEQAQKEDGPLAAVGDTITGLDHASGVVELLWSVGDAAIMVGRGACDVAAGVCTAIGSIIPNV